MANYPMYGLPQGYQPMYQQPVYQQMQPAQQIQPTQQQNTGMVCRPVTSREEALGTPVDFMGGTTVMPNLSDKRIIYTKAFNAQTGQADFGEYRRLPGQEAKEETPQTYAMESDVQALREQVKDLNDKIAVIQARKRPKKEETDNDE